MTTGVNFGELRNVNRNFERQLRDLGGVRSREMRSAGRILANSLRRVLDVPGGASQRSSLKTRRPRWAGGSPSSPGQPPHRQSGKLKRSVKMGAVGDVLRVGLLRFTAPMLQEGVDTALPPPKHLTQKRRGRVRATLRARSRKKRRGVLKIAPRPFMGRALTAVIGRMNAAFVSAVRTRTG